MLIKSVVVVLLLLILSQLFQALWLMVGSRQTNSPPLGRRVLLSALLVLLLVIALQLGWITPHSRPY
ncbi:DUF2909 family protein [Aeromonas schubertii]|uniref:DUF2909 family protein n=1 Tax=Aeromonas schubertii TaxID=652 RepID=A0A0S2SGS9_9GAMM|nr:DUF2909 family protein [Aeromonas schubertii]ALP40892.1 hypothetical protein WL1483_1473 [Aeromonas schubertii]KUE81318.1 hypothetical protein ATO46_12560 [Aeromonas schubertii]MBZ6068364.1 DUF2909 family protein [Aeromonas schubertii]MBZ6073112.1 DUF2909 family protein [Aeromonas schubertii]QCG47824.1 DUF2909 family protein [Aeromonas schubertii]